MTPTRLVSICLLWLACLLAVCTCALQVGVELAAPSPDVYAIARLAAASLVMLIAASALTVVVPSLPRRARQRGAALPAMLALLAIGAVACSACGAIKKEGRAIAADAVKCAKETTELGPLIENVLLGVVNNDGSVDKPKLAELTKPLSDTAFCVVLNVSARMRSRLHLEDAPKSEPLDTAPLAAAVDELRLERFPDTRFVIEESL